MESLSNSFADSNSMSFTDDKSEGKDHASEILTFIAFWLACFFICFICPFLGCVCNTLISLFARIESFVISIRDRTGNESRREHRSTSLNERPKISRKSLLLQAMEPNRMASSMHFLNTTILT